MRDYDRVKEMDGEVPGIADMLRRAKVELKKSKRVDYYALLDVQKDCSEADIKKVVTLAVLPPIRKGHIARSELDLACLCRRTSALRCATIQIRRHRRSGQKPRRSSSRLAPRWPSCPTRTSGASTMQVCGEPLCHACSVHDVWQQTAHLLSG